MCNVVKDAKLFIEGGNTPVKLLEERSKFTSPLSESKASGRSPFRLLPLTDLRKQESYNMHFTDQTRMNMMMLRKKKGEKITWLLDF
jgi:hypothetical protein